MRRPGLACRRRVSVAAAALLLTVDGVSLRRMPQAADEGPFGYDAADRSRPSTAASSTTTIRSRCTMSRTRRATTRSTHSWPCRPATTRRPAVVYVHGAGSTEGLDDRPGALARRAGRRDARHHGSVERAPSLRRPAAALDRLGWQRDLEIRDVVADTARDRSPRRARGRRSGSARLRGLECGSASRRDPRRASSRESTPSCWSRAAPPACPSSSRPPRPSSAARSRRRCRRSIRCATSHRRGPGRCSSRTVGATR